MTTDSQRLEKFLITGIVDPVRTRSPIQHDTRPLNQYQQIPVDYMRRHTRLMVVHGTGSGKSKTAGHIVDDYLVGNKIALVIAPGSVMSQLRKNILAVTGLNKRVFFLSYELMGMMFSQRKPQFRRLIQPWLSRMLVICDEIHTANDKENKMMFRPLFTIFSNAHKMVTMTATPIKNKLKDLVVYMKLLRITVPNSETDYARSFSGKVSVFYKPPRIGPYTVGRGNFPNLNTTNQNVVVRLQPVNRNRILSSRIRTYSQLRTIERQIFTGRNNPKFQKFEEIYNQRPLRSIVYFEEQNSVNDFMNYVHQRMPGVPIAKITGKESKAVRSRAINNMNIQIYAMTSAGKVGLDFKGINNVIFMEYPWTSSDYMQIVGRAVRTGSHNAVPNKTVKVYNLMYRAPPRSSAKFKNEIELGKIKQKQNIGDQVKADLISVSIEQPTVRRLNTPSPRRVRTPPEAVRLTPTTFSINPRTVYSTAAPRSVIIRGVRYSPSNWTRRKGVRPHRPQPQPKPPRPPIVPRNVHIRNQNLRTIINNNTRRMGVS